MIAVVRHAAEGSAWGVLELSGGSATAIPFHSRTILGTPPVVGDRVELTLGEHRGRPVALGVRALGPSPNRAE